MYTIRKTQPHKYQKRKSNLVHPANESVLPITLQRHRSVDRTESFCPSFYFTLCFNVFLGTRNVTKKQWNWTRTHEMFERYERMSWTTNFCGQKRSFDLKNNFILYVLKLCGCVFTPQTVADQCQPCNLLDNKYHIFHICFTVLKFY